MNEALLDRPTLSTEQAAELLHRKPQTLRKWAAHGTGPIRPIRIFGRLAWPTDAIRKLLEGAQ